MYKTILMLSVLVLSSLSITACNTVEGFGEDVQKAGKAINDAAKK
jgi:predicted small secreted protein